MGRGSVQVRHRKACEAPAAARAVRRAGDEWGRVAEARACRCAPTVYVVIDGQWAKVGYLERGWRKADLEPFEEQLVAMRDRARAGEAWQPRKVLRLAEYSDQWFDDLRAAAKAGRISKLTFNSYEGIWANHLARAFGALSMAAIDAAAIRRYVNAKLAGERCTCAGLVLACSDCAGSGWVAAPLAPVTVNATLTPLSAMLTDAVAEGYIAANPARQPRKARHGASRRAEVLADVRRGDPKFLELDEARALLAATPAKYRPMVLAALTTGARRCELLALRWETIDFARRRAAIVNQLQRGELVPCKYGSAGEVVLYSGLATELGPLRRAEGYVFLDPDGKPWTNDGPAREFLVAAYEAAGLRRPGQLWHVLRHTFASALAAGGVRRDVVERLMRHARKGTTSIYTHLFADAFDGVEEALHAAFGGAAAPQLWDGAGAAGVNGTSTAGSVPTVRDRHPAADGRSRDPAPRLGSRPVLDGAAEDT
jgi:integrase